MKRITIIIALIASVAFAVGDDANPHELKTIAAKAAWRNFERDMQAEQARHEREVKNIQVRAIADLHKARSLAANQENADEIVRIEVAIKGLKKDGAFLRSTEESLDGTTWMWSDGNGGDVQTLIFKSGQWSLQRWNGEFKPMVRNGCEYISDNPPGKMIFDGSKQSGLWIGEGGRYRILVRR